MNARSLLCTFAALSLGSLAVMQSPALADSADPTTRPDTVAVAIPTTQPSTQPSNMNHATPLPTGAVAPDFQLSTNTGKQITLGDYQGKQIVVLYFYPKAGTPGCTKEACAFRDAIASYDKANVAVLGISPDPVTAIESFGNANHLNFPLLSDADHKVAEEYGVWQLRTKKDGTTAWGAARTTFVIGKDGKIIHVFEKVNPEGHDQQVLAWLQSNAL
jgi:thioredoxin-dependent peroxiredoxin